MHRPVFHISVAIAYFVVFSLMAYVAVALISKAILTPTTISMDYRGVAVDYAAAVRACSYHRRVSQACVVEEVSKALGIKPKGEEVRSMPVPAGSLGIASASYQRPPVAADRRPRFIGSLAIRSTAG